MKKGLLCLLVVTLALCGFAQPVKNVVVSFDAEPSEIRKDAKLAKEWTIAYFSQMPEWKVLPREDDFNALLKEIKLALATGNSEDGSNQIKSANYILRGKLFSFEINEPQNLCLKLIDYNSGSVVCAISVEIKPRDRFAIEAQIQLMLQKISEEPKAVSIEPALVSQKSVQPTANVTPSTVNIDQRAPVSICFVVDNSGSMEWNDPAAKLKETKRAKAIELLVNMLESGDEVGFVMFSDTAKIINISNKYIETIKSDEASRQKNKYVNIARNELASEGSTNIEKAFEKSLEAMTSATNNQKAVIFLTDGSPTAGITDKSMLIEQAKGYIKNNIGVFCIGLGNVNSEDLDRKFLSTIASNTKPSYYINADSPDSLPVFMQQITSMLLGRTVLCSGVGTIRQNKEEYWFNIDTQVGEEIFVYIQHEPGANYDFYNNDLPVNDVVLLNKRNDYKLYKIRVKGRYGAWKVERLLPAGGGKAEMFKNILMSFAVNNRNNIKKMNVMKSNGNGQSGSLYELAGMFKKVPMDDADSVTPSFFAVTSKSELKITSKGLKAQYEVKDPVRFMVNVGPLNIEDSLDLTVNINSQGGSGIKTLKPKMQELGTAYYEFIPDEAGYYGFVVFVKGSRNVQGAWEPFERQLSLGGAEVIAPLKPVVIPKEAPKPVNEYVVVKGDCLWKVVNKLALQGINITSRKLYVLNKKVIGNNPNLIEIGMLLKHQ